MWVFSDAPIKLRPFPRPCLTSWLCHWHPILYLGFTDGWSCRSLFPASFNLSIVPALPFSCSSCLNCHIDRYHQFLRGCFYMFVSALMSSTRQWAIYFTFIGFTSRSFHVFTVFSCLVSDTWNLIFDLVTIPVLLPPAPCHFICTPHNSPFWDLCTLASDLPRTAVAHTTKFCNAPISALISHPGYVISTPSFVWASQMASLAGLSFPPHLIHQSFALFPLGPPH